MITVRSRRKFRAETIHETLSVWIAVAGDHSVDLIIVGDHIDQTQIAESWQSRLRQFVQGRYEVRRPSHDARGLRQETRYPDDAALLFEEANAFNRHRDPVGKYLEQLSIIVGEMCYFLATRMQNAQGPSLRNDRDRDDGSKTPALKGWGDEFDR
jgi:hypothetical protein